MFFPCSCLISFFSRICTFQNILNNFSSLYEIVWIMNCLVNRSANVENQVQVLDYYIIYIKKVQSKHTLVISRFFAKLNENENVLEIFLERIFSRITFFWWNRNFFAAFKIILFNSSLCMQSFNMGVNSKVFFMTSIFKYW